LVFVIKANDALSKYLELFFVLAVVFHKRV